MKYLTTSAVLVKDRRQVTHAVEVRHLGPSRTTAEFSLVTFTTRSGEGEECVENTVMLRLNNQEEVRALASDMLRQCDDSQTEVQS